MLFNELDGSTGGDSSHVELIDAEEKTPKVEYQGTMGNSKKKFVNKTRFNSVKPMHNPLQPTMLREKRIEDSSRIGRLGASRRKEINQSKKMDESIAHAYCKTGHKLKSGLSTLQSVSKSTGKCSEFTCS